jgi:lactoylglutathione lyase
MPKPIHSMIRVLDETRSVDFYRRALAMRVADRFAFDSFTLVYLLGDTGEFELELTINHGRSDPYALGDAYGHIAFAVEDLVAEHARVTAKGWRRRRSANSIGTAA